MSRSLSRLVVAVALLGGLAVLAVASEGYLAEYIKPPWMSECDRVDYRCSRSAASDLTGAAVCAGTGIANLIARSEDTCAKANGILDDRKRTK